MAESTGVDGKLIFAKPKKICLTELVGGSLDGQLGISLAFVDAEDGLFIDIEHAIGLYRSLGEVLSRIEYEDASDE